MVVVAASAGRNGRAIGNNHCYLTIDQVGGECRQSIVYVIRPAIFDRYVPTFHMAGSLSGPV
jgi:hypothetical protein